MFFDAHRLRNVLPALLALVGLGLPSAVADCTCCESESSCCIPKGDAANQAQAGVCCSSAGLVNDACACLLEADDSQCLCGGGCLAPAGNPPAVPSDEPVIAPISATASSRTPLADADFATEFSWQRQTALAWVARPPRILYGVWRN
jgi:hypothetical protein